MCNYTVKNVSVMYLNFTYQCLGTNISTTEEVAIKLECIKSKHPQLHIEAKFYKMMQSGGVLYLCVYVHACIVYLKLVAYWHP